MRIKGFFFILVLLLLTLGGVLLYLSSMANSNLFYIGEGLVLFLLFYLIFFYRKIVKPLKSIGNGMELLREQDFSSRLSPVGQHEADHIVNIFNRMMEQLKNERLRLREQNNFLDLLIEASPMGVIITSLDHDLSQLNPMARKMLGVREEDIRGKKMKDIDSPLAAELANVPKGETVTLRLNDSTIYRCTHSSFIDRGFQHPFFLIESLTEEVMKAEKKAYEKVIRMIAHEVNNTTAGITSTLDTVEQALSTEEGMEDICDVMRVCTDRCFSMSRFITRFADVVKIPEPTFSSVNLNDLVFTCKRFMEGMCNGRNINLRTDIDESLTNVKLDAALLEQVLVNIIKNAAESIEADGEILVRTLPPATIEVVDNGKGISKEAEAKLFSPFFSTKPNGQGIGLIFIREVLMRHGCTFSLRTYADGLTRFRIVFP
ncbi:PAS domain-containing sensor histidine kinase [uncultured Bacteroides sp.]|uniref:sensor histidine kinase n=1 Tax=uncultured Bacteroides sp. TaxID=162156 RepID=UPI0025E10632|nr:ATP-binding protein [uncultured Bacteroides sp.]